MTDGFLTLAAPAEASVEVKRSRFLCRVEPISTETAARAVVEAARRQHWNARHHCSAFVLGTSGEVKRSSDDGEPTGTAGAPMLEVLRGRELTNVVAVVTRWFGGVLLGSGGLVRAYGDAVRAALDVAEVVERRRMHLVAVDVPHADVGRLEHELRTRGIQVLGVDYTDHATLHLAVPAATADALGRMLAEVTGGEVHPIPVGTTWA